MRHQTLILLTSATLLSGCDAFLGAPPKVASVEIVPESLVIAENEWKALTAVVRDGNGQVIPGVPVYWTSRDYSIVYVGYQEGPGITGYAVGSTIIEAHVDGKIATAKVTVTRGVVKTVYVTPNRVLLLPGQTFQLYANAQDARAYPLRNRVATYVSSNTAVATVSSYGAVTGVAPGLASITVTVEGVSTEVLLRVSPQVVSFDYWKRGGAATPATAVLTFASKDISRGSLAIDGRVLPVVTYTSYDTGVNCVFSQYSGVAPPPDAITRCVFDAAPLTMRLCTSVNGVPDPGQLQYVLMPQNDSGRVASTATALLAAVRANTTMLGINVYPNCAATFSAPNIVVSRWIPHTASSDFLLWPNTTTVHSAASVAALLDGAAIFSAPNPGNDSKRFAAVRVGTSLFEVWH
jgi:hypothetical protein